MSEFFTWEQLGTYTGAVLATALITQLLKGISFIDKMPTRIFSYIVAVIVLLASMFASNNASLSSALLCIINAVVVSLASNGAFDGMNSVATKRKNT